MLGKIIWFLLFISCGLGLIVYTEKVKRFVGDFDFAEQYLGSGGTYTFIKILGLLIIIGSFLWITGTFHRIIPDILINPSV